MACKFCRGYSEMSAGKGRSPADAGLDVGGGWEWLAACGQSSKKNVAPKMGGGCAVGLPFPLSRISCPLDPNKGQLGVGSLASLQPVHNADRGLERKPRKVAMTRVANQI